MKHAYAFIGLSIVLLLLAACERQAVQETQERADQMVKEAEALLPDGATPTEPAAATIRPTPGEGIEGVPVVLPDVVQKLIDTARKVKSYRYDFSMTPNLNQLVPTMTKGNRVRLELYQPPRYDAATYYNVVYLDLEKQTAVGYCEDRTRCRDRMNARVDVDFQTHKPKLAIDWLDEIDPATVQVLQTQTIDQRPATRIQYQSGGVTNDMWLDETYGLPLKVVINTPEPVTYQYGKLVANTVIDSELAEPVQK
jgi:hypothetical protein